MSSIVHTKKAQDILKNYRINFNEDLDQIFDINKFKTKIPAIIKDEISEESQRVFYSSLVTEAIANTSEFLNKNPNFSIKNSGSKDLEELRTIIDPLISCNIKLYFIYLQKYYTHLLEKLKDLNPLKDTKTNSDSCSIEAKITYFKYFYHYLENRPEFDPFLRPGQYSASDLKDKIENGLNLLLKEIENSGLFNPIFLTDTDIYIDTLDTTLLYFLKECKKDFQKLFDTLPKVISFEGVDATGKGTFSKTLELVLNAVGTVGEVGMVGEVNTVSIEAKRINVPDYSTYYGKNIKNRLETSTDITSLIELDNTIYTFALNRKEILNDLQRMGSAGKKKKNITIFDRQTTSSCAFTCGKLLTEAYTKYNKSILIKSNSIGEKKTLKEIIFGLLKFDTQDTKNPQPDPANQNILTILFELFDYIYKVYYTEFDILSNVKPNLEVFCFSDLDTIQKRIQLRRKTTNPDTNPDNDVHEKDAHEDNFKIIEFTNAIYAFIYDISTVYKELREKCQKLNYSKRETDSVLWFETVKVLEEYIITSVDDNDIREEYIKRINNYQNLFTIWFNYQETVMIYNDFENYKENSILNFSEKIIFNMIQYMNTINQNEQNNQNDQTNSN